MLIRTRQFLTVVALLVAALAGQPRYASSASWTGVEETPEQLCASGTLERHGILVVACDPRQELAGTRAPFALGTTVPRLRWSARVHSDCAPMRGSGAARAPDALRPA